MLSHNETQSNLMAELDNLRQRIAQLEQEHTHYRQRIAQLEQERAQQTRHQEQLQLALEASQDGLWDWDLPSGTVTFTPHCLEIVGYEPGELPETINTFERLVHPDDLSRVMQAMQAFIAGHQATYMEQFRMRSKTGEWKYILARAKIVANDGSGNPVRIIGVHTDITERKRQEEDLRQLLAASPVVLFRCRVSGGSGDSGITYVSENVSHLLGYAPQDFTADSQFWARHIHPNDAPRVFADLSRIFEYGEHTLEYRFQMKDGSYRWIHDQLRLIRDEQGNPIEMVGSWQDITARKQQEEDARLFKLLVERAIDGFAIADLPDAHFRFTNAAYQTLLGYQAHEFAALQVPDVFAEDPEYIRTLIANSMQIGSWSGVLNYRRKDGSTFPGQLSAFIIPDQTGQPELVVGIVRDLTAQYQAEAERAALQQQIIDIQREALRELSTPLIPISDKVVIMPLIGTIDSLRAAMVMETLLEGIARHHSHLVIIDITGVAVVDTQVAQAFIRAAQAVKLLGARVMLTGIQPQIAQTLVHLGADLSGIMTYGSLQAGIAAALKHYE